MFRRGCACVKEEKIIVMNNPYGQVGACSAINVTKINGVIHPVALSYQLA